MRPALSLLAAALTLAAIAQTPPQPATEVFALRHATLFDGTGAPPRPDTTILIAGPLIRAIQPDATKLPKGTREIDLHGAFVMPGLISAHSHVGLLLDNAQNSAKAYTRENVLNALNTYERYGVTTVLSLGLNRDLVYAIRSEQRNGQLGGATLLTAGRGIGVPDGAPPIPTQPDQVYRPATSDEARHDVDELAQRHADIVKVWVDPLHGKAPDMPPDITSAVIAESHLKNLRVAAHEYLLADAKRLVGQGIDVLAHSVRDQPIDPELLTLMKQHGTWYIPTFTVDESFFLYAAHPDFMNSRFFQQAAGPQLLTRLHSPDYINGVNNNPDTPQHQADFAMDRRNLKIVFDAGLPIAFGTDTGAAAGRIPGFSEHRELEDWTAAGLTPIQILTIATGKTGQLIHELDPTLHVGELVPNYSADLLVLDADPTTDILNTRRIHAIYHQGREIPNPAPEN